jgi:hypothetical protein
MGTFDYPPPSNAVRYILDIPHQPKDAIFQVASFRTSYFNDSWIVPYPSNLIEGVGNLRMAMPLSIIEVA